MEQFIVSARKYRPSSFESLIDQENIARTLKNSINREQLAHAYLFCGPRGVGKTSAARIFAKAINCLNPSDTNEACGECESCLSFAEGRSYCIHELDAASNNTVDDIRNLIELVRVPPQIGKYSVYIIDEVHMLSSQAFNAFLKTLEEPPSYAIFILATTEKHKILPTILSRCQTYDFNRISIEGIIKNLKQIAQREDIKIDDDALHILAQKADGAMRDALTLFDQTVSFCGKDISYESVIKNLNVLNYEYYFDLCEAFLSHDHIKALLLFDEVLSKGFNAYHFISGLSSHFRDLVVCKNNASKSLMSLPPSLISRYEELSEKTSVSFLFKALEICTACEASYRQSGNQRLLIEFALMKLSQETKPAEIRVEKTASAEKSQKIEKVEKTEKDEKVESIEKVEKVESVEREEKEETKQIEHKEEVLPKSKPNITPNKGISIKSLMEDVTNNIQSSVVEIQEDIEFGLDEANQAWKALSDNMNASGKKSLAMEMLRQSLTLENTTITFYVSNSAQKEWIENKCLLDMVTFLRQTLKNQKTNLNIEVRQESPSEDTRDKLYMPTQIAKHFESQVGELKEFIKELDLDIK